ncbi:actin filament-associated protein 1-like 2 [Polypterus senegalus]|uniref:actin filament-associated protein 1-like 2 n=1 Tax=Polypterus senegalus TaxID=55291 RepID=UPI001966182D|nr:actin filament-associated protein 1-like 2 [Polypterus senegalus]
MDKQRDLNQLISDLQSFLLVLDQENLSFIAQAKKKSISELLSKLQDPSSEDAEYMIMNCPAGADQSKFAETQATLMGSLQLPERQTIKDPSSSSEWTSQLSKQNYITSFASESFEDDCYEEAEPFVPASHSTECLDSDSSHYESYGEEEDDDVKDRAHYIQWTALQTTLKPVAESRICGFLWRKKWLGQWTKQLFVIRNHLLLCYKCAKDLHPLLELSLRGCQVTYKSKHSKKMQHELKVATTSETVVIGFQSCEQAEEWRKVIEEVSGSPCFDKEADSSCSVSLEKLVEPSKASHNSAMETKIQKKGFLNILMNCQWQSLWCNIEDGVLKMYKDDTCSDSAQYSIHLHGCEVKPGPDTAQSFRVTISQQSVNMAVLETGSSEDRDNWLHLLLDRSSIPSEECKQSPLDSFAHCDAANPLSGLLSRRFPAPNMYIDDPFQQQSGAKHTEPVYSNTDVLEQMILNSKNMSLAEASLSRVSCTYSNNEVSVNHSTQNRKPELKVEDRVHKLDAPTRTKARMKAGSEMNLLTVGKSIKRTSFRQSLAFSSDPAGSEGGFLTPLLRRTASAKSCLKRAPSSFLIEKSKCFQKKKDLETKASI